ncbi:TPA: hypothetical protein ACH9ZT_004965, partial [Escherichia coli]
MSIDLLFSITEITIVVFSVIYVFTSFLLMRKIYLDKVIIIIFCLFICVVIIQLPELNEQGL